jgi:uncharacterized membrane protein (GlpM family)
MNRLSWSDIFIRFLIGGTVLVIVYVLSIYVPWRSFAGVFAAFPGVMATAVSLAGWRQGSETAADVATGSVVGMLGGTACVIAMLWTLPVIKSWGVALVISIITWFVVSLILHVIWGRKVH